MQYFCAPLFHFNYKDTGKSILKVSYNSLRFCDSLYLTLSVDGYRLIIQRASIKKLNPVLK